MQIPGFTDTIVTHDNNINMMDLMLYTRCEMGAMPLWEQTLLRQFQYDLKSIETLLVRSVFKAVSVIFVSRIATNIEASHLPFCADVLQFLCFIILSMYVS